jgi:hypothetical protein
MEDSTNDSVNVTETNVTKTRVTPPQRSLKARSIIYYILGILEILFTFRLILKVLGANPDSPFVSLIYSISNLFLAPFNGIFRTAVTEGIETESVLEPSLIIAMIVYAAFAWGMIKLIDIFNNRNDSNTV